ncbi:hypothetical protein F511_43322 [Dorcoceras hygrometricum]|uniref:Uncharacterized protein n=1 Tax=Dorcoceras hygrometricum TaxID=472368 RepID=A0A2Z7C5W5_9LAMI|nr:hypothetical protein F511_43322 [Dorcoceras hygrometricum]
MGVIALIVCLLVVNAGQPSCSAKRMRHRFEVQVTRGSLIMENASTIAPAGFVGGNVLLLVAAAFTRVFGISSSVIVLSIRYGFELVLRRGYGLDELLRGRAVIPHSHLPAGIVATMHRVVNYHSSWARQQQVELFDASGNPGSTAGRGFNPAGGAPGAGLAMETSKVKSGVRNQAEANLNQKIQAKQLINQLDNQTQATSHPVVSQNEPAVAIHPVARSIQSTSYSGSSRELQYYCISSRHGIPDARKAEVAKRCNQAQSIQSTKNSAEAQSSSRHESAAKQLTIYESWMSTAELL